MDSEVVAKPLGGRDQSAVVDDERRDLLQALAALQIREHERTLATQPQRVRFHHREIRAHQRSEIDLVDHQQIGPGDSRAAFPGDLFAFRDVDDVDRQVRQLRAERRREIVAARFDEAEIGSWELEAHLVERGEVHGSVFPDCGMRATASLHAHDALRRQRLGAREDELVFLRVDVVGDHVDVVLVAESLAEGFDQGGLTRSDGTADPDPQRMSRQLRGEKEGHDRNNLVYWVSCFIDARSNMNAADPRSSIVVSIACSVASRTARSRAAIARWPSVWPRGISRTPAVTRLAT